MTEVIVRRRKYHWPEQQLNIWLLAMLISSGIILGIFADFISVQNQLGLPSPWLFAYEVTVSALAILFLVLILILISQRMLLPGIVILGSFILFVLWLTGLIETSIQLYGTGNVNNNCQNYVTNDKPPAQPTVETLAWIEQNSICSAWKTAFAHNIVGTVFLLWMMIMSWQVNRDEYD
ncbi:hypothetical protein MMC12_007686 [Toensbergia leucococca]|nr:hypothetical protein [Toensbergia leucococca]